MQKDFLQNILDYNQDLLRINDNCKRIRNNYIICLRQIYFKRYEKRKRKKEIRNEKVTYNEKDIYIQYI